MGYRFKDPELLQRALTHRSFSNEMRLVPHNELLEFIGDSVLGLVVAQILFEDNPEAGEGRLSRIRSAAVNRESLAEVARRIGIGQHLRLGRGEGQSGGREKDSLLANAFEALLGAVYLEGGLKAARKVVERCLKERLRGLLEDKVDFDPKSRLQELVQQRHLPPPEYRLVSKQGPDHQPTYRVAVIISGREVASGEGSSRKSAEQTAAFEALRQQRPQEEKP
jgi:ribonuclease-3